MLNYPSVQPIDPSTIPNIKKPIPIFPITAHLLLRKCALVRHELLPETHEGIWG